MERYLLRSWVVLAVVLWLFSCASSPPPPPSSPATVSASDLESAQEKLRERQAEISLLESENRWLIEEATDLRSENEVLAAANEKLTESIKNLTVQIQTLNAELDRQRSVVRIQNEVIALLDDTRNTIASSLQEQISADKIEVREGRDRLRLLLLDTIVFEPGSMELAAEGKKVLAALAESVREQTQPLVVEGHTDSLPIGENLRNRLPSNWELSAARAAAVVRFLQFEGGIDPKRLSIRAYSFYRPIADNRTEEGRRRNRRIEIVLGETQP